MSETILYVKTDPAAKRLSEDDRAALQLLAASGLEYKIVDLTLTGGAVKYFADQLDVKSTPTLIREGKKFEGLQAITELIKSLSK